MSASVPPTILLVEDDPIVRTFLADNLTADGFAVHPTDDPDRRSPPLARATVQGLRSARRIPKVVELRSVSPTTLGVRSSCLIGSAIAAPAPSYTFVQ